MKFTDFLSLIENIKSASLPGEESQLKMTPPERRKLMEEMNLKKVNPKLSAVMILIFNKNEEAHVYLMKRNTYEGVHSAQVSFPGGKVEPNDQNLMATAIRETHEEFGFSDESYQIIRELTELYIPPSNFMVYPFLSVMQNRVEVTPNPDEVVEIIEMPLSFLLEETNVVSKNLTTSYSIDIEVPVFDFEGKIIWGATAMMLSELKDLIKSAKL